MNAAKVGKVKEPGVKLKLLLLIRRYSPPNLKLWLPLVQLNVSDTTPEYSPRPWGKPWAPQKANPVATFWTVIWGKPMGEFTPLLIPKSAAFEVSLDTKVMWMRLYPKRASLTSFELKPWVSLMVMICRRPCR